MWGGRRACRPSQGVGRAEGVPAVPGVHGVDVLDLAVALHFDVAGHGDLGKAVETGVRLPEIGRPCGGIGAVGKTPGAVQALAQVALGGLPDVVGVGVQPVDCKDARVFQPFQFGMGSVHGVTSLQGSCKTEWIRDIPIVPCRQKAVNAKTCGKDAKTNTRPGRTFSNCLLTSVPKTAMIRRHSVRRTGCPRGEMSEWFKEAVLKTAVRQRTVGSNPTLSAILIESVLVTLLWSSTQEAEEAPLLRA